MPLAIFDLDNTLLGGDSDHAWGEFACEQGLTEAADFAARNDAFYRDYQAGTLDIDAYLRHALSPLIGQSADTIERWHRDFMRTKIEPLLLPKSSALLASHRDRGDQLIIITATNRFVSEPIARRLGVRELLASEGETIAGVYTGEPRGVPSYAAGKITRLQNWMAQHGQTLAGSYFYSDSHNDLPLLSIVDYPVAVDPDARLRTHARQHDWPIISLRE